MTTPRPDVFLSYSREDQSTARRFAEALQREGFNVWWDQTLSTGEAYDSVTEQALDSARSVVVLWSKTSVSSRWVRAEATTADRNGVLMPVMIEECRRPVMFELMQTAELGHWNGDPGEPAWRAFVADLKRLVLRGQPPEAAVLLERAAHQAGESPHPPTPAPARVSSTRPWLTVGIAAVVAGLLAAGFLGWQRMNRVKQARAQVPEIAKLVDAGDFQAAFTRAQQVRRYVPDDPLLASLTPLFTAEYSIKSDPEGADVYARAYDGDKDPWIHVGRTPLERVALPRRAMLWRFEKEGFVTAERANTALGNQNAIGGFLAPEAGKLEVKLWTPEQQPSDMVYVPGGPGAGLSYAGLPQAAAPPFFIDRNEVTNAKFKEFVEAGGYERRQYWEGMDIRDTGGKLLSFEGAMKRFIDSTGRPGPANWELGSYPQGRGEYPVTGVSWYEAAAYARFRNRSLPSVSHWIHAAMRGDEIGSSLAASIAPLSNFGTSGPAPVGQYQGTGLYGTHDLYGNVREWLSNPGPGGGWVIGGGWEDPTYSYADAMPAPLMERSAQNGFRLMRPTPESADDAALHVAFSGKAGRTDILAAKPISEELYATYSRHFAYRPGPLNATAPETMASTEDWIKQRVTIDAGYEGKRMDVILFIPRRTQPPFQPIVLFSGMQMFLFPATVDSIEPGFAALPLDFIVKSGRVLVQPIFEGTYERFQSPVDFSDQIRMTREYAAWRSDLGRALDYLETRTDVDAKHIGYIGLSFGSSAALPLLATEPRLKAAVLVAGGIPPQNNYPPMVDPLNYASRIKMPVLMFNGRFDAGFTVEGHQKPLFRLLGTPAADKRHVILDYGHASPPRGDLLRESLAWYDKYLGPVYQ